jgi:hypothetical protein
MGEVRVSDERFCEYDGEALSGMRADARFCKPACRKAFDRHDRKPKGYRELGPPIVQATAPDLAPDDGFVTEPWKARRTPREAPHRAEPGNPADTKAFIRRALGPAAMEHLKRRGQQQRRSYGFEADDAFDVSHGPAHEARYPSR